MALVPEYLIGYRKTHGELNQGDARCSSAGERRRHLGCCKAPVLIVGLLEETEMKTLLREGLLLHLLWMSLEILHYVGRY